MKRTIHGWRIAGALALATATAPAALVYEAGHGDIGVAYEAGELHLHFHIEEGLVGGSWVEDQEYEPGDLRVWVPEGLRSTLSAPFPLLGAGSGDSVWLLPESDPGIAPHLGWATEEMATGPWSDLRFTIQLASGPAGGEFAIWQASGLVGLFSTADPSAPGYFDLAAGLHDHFTLGFTAPGLWEIEITVSGTHSADGFKSSETETFSFLVVPEPSSAALAGLGVLGLAMRRRR